MNSIFSNFQKLSFPELSIPHYRHLPPSIQNFLRVNGNEHISHLKIARKPITSKIRTLGNLLSFGQLERNLKSVGYDKIFHLYLLVWTIYGELKVYVLEKNQTIELKPARPEVINGPGVEIYDVGHVDVPWTEFFSKGEHEAEVMGKDFFVYDARTDNC